jgi:hypothetical protein
VVDYTNRQVDIELLQHIAQPVELQLVHVTNVRETPKIVAGIEKMVQRYALLLLSSLGTVRFENTQGSNLLAAVLAGMIFNEGQLTSIFALANTAVLQQLHDDNVDTDTFGDIPADEQIAVARLEDVDIDIAQSKLTLTIKLITEAGTDITFIVPVTAAR